jgi:hypothetical protein
MDAHVPIVAIFVIYTPPQSYDVMLHKYVTFASGYEGLGTSAFHPFQPIVALVLNGIIYLWHIAGCTYKSTFLINEMNDSLMNILASTSPIRVSGKYEMPSGMKDISFSECGDYLVMSSSRMSGTTHPNICNIQQDVSLMGDYQDVKMDEDKITKRRRVASVPFRPPSEISALPNIAQAVGQANTSDFASLGISSPSHKTQEVSIRSYSDSKLCSTSLLKLPESIRGKSLQPTVIWSSERADRIKIILEAVAPKSKLLFEEPVDSDSDDAVLFVKESKKPSKSIKKVEKSEENDDLVSGKKGKMRTSIILDDAIVSKSKKTRSHTSETDGMKNSEKAMLQRITVSFRYMEPSSDMLIHMFLPRR